MARTAQLTREDQLTAIVEALRNQTPVATPNPVKTFFADRAVDTVAASGVFLGRMKAALESAGDTYNDGYQLERERQLKLRAERILAAQQH